MKTKEQLREEAMKRQIAREMRTIRQQLDLLTQRRGESKREKQRLLDQLDKLQKDFHSNGKTN